MASSNACLIPRALFCLANLFCLRFYQWKKLEIFIYRDQKAKEWACLTCKWKNKPTSSHCGLCSWEHAYSIRSLPSEYVDRATMVLDGRRYFWNQTLNGKWKRTSSDVEKLLSIANLRKFSFNAGNHVGTIEPPSHRIVDSRLSEDKGKEEEVAGLDQDDKNVDA